MKSILLASTSIILFTATLAVAQTTWTVTPNSGFTIQDQGVSSDVLTFTLNGSTWTVSPSSNTTVNDQGITNNVLTFTISPAISPDGLLITSGSNGSLATSAGVWTFGTTASSGGYQILLNGASAGGGAALELEVNNGGNMYALNSLDIWFAWNGSAWSEIAPLNGRYVISVGTASGIEYIDGGFGATPGTSPFVQLDLQNHAIGQQWIWNGSTLQNVDIPVRGASGAASGPYLADAGNGTATEKATGDTFKLIPARGGYNIKDLTTGNYLGLANGELVVGAKYISVWSFTAP
jgi:hypothetical protein